MSEEGSSQDPLKGGDSGWYPRAGDGNTRGMPCFSPRLYILFGMESLASLALPASPVLPPGQNQLNTRSQTLQTRERFFRANSQGCRPETQRDAPSASGLAPSPRLHPLLLCGEEQGGSDSRPEPPASGRQRGPGRTHLDTVMMVSAVLGTGRAFSAGTNQASQG